VTAGGTWGGARWWGRLALAAMVVGTVLRLAALLEGRPLWLDEAMLALNVMGRSYHELLMPLDYDQAAPPLFLWLSRWLGTLADGQALALRIVPLAAGLLLLPTLWWFGKTVFSPATGAVATIAAAGSPALIYYSTEFKPYMSDATITVALLGLAWLVAEAAPGGPRWWCLFWAGMLALGMSLTAPLALATAGAILVLRGWRLGQPTRALVAHLGMGAAWAAAFGVLYHYLVQPAAANQYLREFWAAEFLRAIPSLHLALYKVGAALSLPLPLPAGGIRMAVLLPVVGVLGLLAAHRFGWLRILPWAGTVGVVLVVSWLELYPIDGRLLLVVAPLSLLVLAAGLVAMVERLRSGPRLRSAAVAAPLLALLVWADAPLGRGPGSLDRDPEVLEAVLRRPADAPVYMLTGGAPQYVYYATDWSAPHRPRLLWYAREVSSGGRGFRNAEVGAAELALLSPPGHPLEILAPASGAVDGRVTPSVAAWADRQVSGLIDIGAAEIWVYLGPYRERERPALLAALARRGIPWRVLHQSGAESALVVATGQGRR